jgi:hypothetical protein
LPSASINLNPFEPFKNYSSIQLYMINLPFLFGPHEVFGEWEIILPMAKLMTFKNNFFMN